MQHIALVAVFNKNDEVLLLKRSDDAHCGGLWSFPGGKIESGESAIAAAHRELAEETGLAGKHWRCLGQHRHRYPDRLLLLHLFACRQKSSEAPSCTEPYCWADADRLAAYPMPEANRLMLRALIP